MLWSHAKDKGPFPSQKACTHQLLLSKWQDSKERVSEVATYLGFSDVAFQITIN